jgi:hypothetical protein
MTLSTTVTDAIERSLTHNEIVNTDYDDDDDNATPCECGHWMGDACQGVLGDDSVIIEWMPECWRESHRAAGNAGEWPNNGAERLRVTAQCAQLMLQTDGEWCRLAAAEALAAEAANY